MTISEDSQREIGAYLGTLRKRLRGLRDDDVREIVEEMRSHILDRAMVEGSVTPAGVKAALTGLGSPEQLASQYMTDDLLARAQATGSLLLIVRSLFRWASISIAGFFVMLGSLVGYLLGIVFVWAAFLKPIHSQTVGLWMIPQTGTDYELSLHMGFSGPPAHGHELLGWWIIPLGLVVGFGLFFGTLRVDQWCIGKFRESRPLRVRG
jgi:hypothetical protein